MLGEAKTTAWRCKWPVQSALASCHNRNESLGPHFKPCPRHLLKRPVSQVANPQHLAPKTNAGRGLRVHSPVAPAGGSRVLPGAKGVNPGIVAGPSWATTARSGPILPPGLPLSPPGGVETVIPPRLSSSTGPPGRWRCRLSSVWNALRFPLGVSSSLFHLSHPLHPLRWPPKVSRSPPVNTTPPPFSMS